MTDGGGSSLVLDNSLPQATRNGTTWPANNGALAADGWTATPAIGSSAGSFQFIKAAAGATNQLLLTFQNGTALNFPLTFMFSAAETPSTSSVTVNRTNSDPFITA